MIYNDKKIKENLFVRIFNNDIDEMELVWHRDRNTRIIKPLNENDWQLQIDNELPFHLSMNKSYIIKKDVYHRLIKGTTILKILIREI